MTIIFIDDDHDDTELFCEAVEYLNSSGYIHRTEEKISCIAVNDGCKAVELLPTLEPLPDYIFLDINMPIMGGKECLKFLKQSPRFSQIPVIMLSTAFHKEDFHELLNLGAADCIKKPSGFNELVGLLAKYIFKNI